MRSRSEDVLLLHNQSLKNYTFIYNSRYNVSSPMRMEKKNMGMGMLRIGEVMFKNQLGVMGKNRRKSKKKNKLLLFSST